MRKKFKVLDADGKQECVVDREAATGMVARCGYQFWNGGTSIRPIPAQRESLPSGKSLTEFDARALAGVDEMTPRRRERLQGWAESARIVIPVSTLGAVR